VIIKGSGFDPNKTVVITICEDDWIWEEDILVNECGAFEVETTIPDWVTIGEPVSVRAWSDSIDPTVQAI